MLKKLLVIAITSGLAAKAYKAYVQKKQAGAGAMSRTPATVQPKASQRPSA